MGKGTHGTEKLREEAEAENEGMKIPRVIQWLGRPSEVKPGLKVERSQRPRLRSRPRERACSTAFSRAGYSFLGRRYEAEVFEKIGPDALCGS